MCEANVYWKRDEEEEYALLLASVDRIQPGDGEIELEDIFGHKQTVKARIREMTLVDHAIYLEKL